MDVYLLEDHLVLGKSAGFVTKDVLNSAQFLRYLAVPGNGSLDLVIMVDLVGKDRLGNIEVDPETDGDNAGEQEHLPKQIQQPVLAQSPHQHDNNREHAHETKQYLRQHVDLSVSPAHFGPGHVGVHDTPHFPPCVHDDGGGTPIRQEAVAPQGVLQVEALPAPLLLGVGLHFEEPLELVNVQVWLLGIHSG